MASTSSRKMTEQSGYNMDQTSISGRGFTIGKQLQNIGGAHRVTQATNLTFQSGPLNTKETEETNI